MAMLTLDQAWFGGRLQSKFVLNQMNNKSLATCVLAEFTACYSFNQRVRVI